MSAETFEIFIDDDRYAVPTLYLVTAPDEARALTLAERMVAESPHHLGAELCRPGEGGKLKVTDGQVERLEREIDAMNERLAPLNSFVLPGGSSASAYLHQARTVVRRAERLAVRLAHEEPVAPAALRYLNRLSDHLFVLSRATNADGAADVLWEPGATR